ncbi:hypothetical protein NQ317_019576, partial [Molorchus minor]
ATARRAAGRVGVLGRRLGRRCLGLCRVYLHGLLGRLGSVPLIVGGARGRVLVTGTHVAPLAAVAPGVWCWVAIGPPPHPFTAPPPNCAGAGRLPDPPPLLIGIVIQRMISTGLLSNGKSISLRDKVQGKYIPYSVINSQ